MKFDWKIIVILFLNIYLTEECNFAVSPEWEKKYEMLETKEAGEEIGEIPIIINSIENAELIMCSPEEIITCNLNEEKSTITVILKKSVLDESDGEYPLTSIKSELKCIDGENFIQEKFDIKIIDVNNKSPKFEQEIYVFNVRELTPINSKVNSKPINVSDDDSDLSSNAKMTVSLLNDDTKTFELVKDRMYLQGKSNVSIILKKRLDFNKQSIYKLILYVEDHGIPPLNGRAEVILNIIDEDDRDPKFDHFFYESHLIVDKTKEGIIIMKDKNDKRTLLSESKKFLLDNIIPGKIYAYDPDKGINSTIHYKLGKSNWTRYFEINKESGIIYLTTFDLMILKEQKINVPLEAYQTDFEEKRGYACLTVFFKEDVFTPVFIHQIDILNNSLQDDIIYNVKAIGEDLNYSVNDNKFVYINNTSGDIHLLQNATSLFDSFSVNFSANTKFQHVYNIFQGSFHIVQRDYKEPLFKKSVYQIEISRNSYKPEYLFEISKEILDKDVHLNISGEDADYFDLFTHNKEIWIIIKEDIPPKKENFAIIIEADKKGNRMIMQRDSTKLIFHVIDGDCQLKIFEKEIYIINKTSEWKVGDIIYIVETNIADIQFFIQGENEFFSINNTSGEITLKTELDKCQKYQLEVFGYSENPPRKDSTLLIFDTDVCVKKFRKFSQCVYEWNIKDLKENELFIELKDKEFSEENLIFSILSFNNKKDNLDNFKIDESGKLRIIKKLPVGQHFLKLKQENKNRYARSNQIFKINEVGNNEALIVINNGKHEIKEEKKVIFLHSNPLLKFFLPNAPLSDYNFEIKAFSTSNENIQIGIKGGNNTFDINPVTNEIFPIKDISKDKGYETVLTIEVLNFNEEKLNIYIYNLHEDNCLNISTSTNISKIINKAEIERSISSILQQENDTEGEISFHILKYVLKNTVNNFKNFEILGTILRNKTLLTFKEMNDRFKQDHVQQQIQNYFGPFRLTSLLKEKESNDDKNNNNNNIVLTIVLGSLAAFFAIIIIIFFIKVIFKKSKQKQNCQLKEDKFINGNSVHKEQEFEISTIRSLNNSEIIVETTKDLDQVDKSVIHETNPGVNSNKIYYNEAFEHNEDDNFDHNEMNQLDDYENLIKNESHNIYAVPERRKLKSEIEDQSSYDSENSIQAIEANNIKNNQIIENVPNELITVDIDENDLTENEEHNENDKDDDEEEDDDVQFKSRTFSHRDSLTRLASFSEHIEKNSSDEEDGTYVQNPKTSLVTFNDLTEYIP